MLPTLPAPPPTLIRVLPSVGTNRTLSISRCRPLRNNLSPPKFGWLGPTPMIQHGFSAVPCEVTVRSVCAPHRVELPVTNTCIPSVNVHIAPDKPGTD